MAMRRKTAPTVKVKKTWRCPKCGHKIETAECYGCLIEEQRRLKKSPDGEDKASL